MLFSTVTHKAIKEFSNTTPIFSLQGKRGQKKESHKLHILAILHIYAMCLVSQDFDISHADVKQHWFTLPYITALSLAHTNPEIGPPRFKIYIAIIYS